MSKIKSLFAREIIDSRGVPTVEVEIELTSNQFSIASVPSGASTPPGVVSPKGPAPESDSIAAAAKALRDIADTAATVMVSPLY